MPSSLSCWEGSICGWRRCSCVAMGGLGWKSPYAQHIFLLCLFSVLQRRGKASFHSSRSCVNRSLGQMSHHWQCWLMGKMRMAFAPGSLIDFCHQGARSKFNFSCASVWPQKSAASVGLVCAVLWAQQDKCVRQWALSWVIACCPTILPLQHAYLLFSHSLPSLRCQGILRDSSVFENHRSCRALQKVWLCPLGVKEGPQVPGKSGPKWV